VTAYCEGKGASAKLYIPNYGKPGFVAEKPEHCFTYHRIALSNLGGYHRSNLAASLRDQAVNPGTDSTFECGCKSRGRRVAGGRSAADGKSP